ncbi:MAG TPA: hypothetical protein VN903_09540 [Polyangia bacterium]|nr:hypothetical protein [Polyangia bacterium]
MLLASCGTTIGVDVRNSGTRAGDEVVLRRRRYRACASSYAASRASPSPPAPCST